MITTFSIPPKPTKDFADRIKIAAKLLDFKLPETIEIIYYSKKQPSIGMFDIILNALRYPGWELYFASARWIESDHEKIVIETSGLESVADKFAKNLTM